MRPVSSVSNLSGSLSGDGRVSGAVSSRQLVTKARPPSGVYEGCRRLLSTDDVSRLPPLEGLARHGAGGSVELQALHGAGSAIKAGLLAVSVVLFGQGRDWAWLLLRRGLGDPISLSSESVFKGRGGASVAPSSKTGSRRATPALLSKATVM